VGPRLTGVDSEGAGGLQAASLEGVDQLEELKDVPAAGLLALLLVTQERAELLFHLIDAG